MLEMGVGTTEVAQCGDTGGGTRVCGDRFCPWLQEPGAGWSWSSQTALTSKAEASGRSPG